VKRFVILPDGCFFQVSIPQRYCCAS
jgi:hypothetical protein